MTCLGGAGVNAAEVPYVKTGRSFSGRRSVSAVALFARDLMPACVGPANKLSKRLIRGIYV
jgi:hypothetical protein